MDNRIKVLNINLDSNAYSGVCVFLINIFRNIDHSKVQFDFLTPDITAYNLYKEEIEQNKGHIYELHVSCDSTKGMLQFGKKFKSFLERHTYDIIHINSGSVPFDCIAAVVAKTNGLKVIVHSHNDGNRSWWKIPIAFCMKLIMQKNADILCACSQKAAMYTFTARKVRQGKVTIIKNGIDLQKFQYNEKIRNKVRKELGVESYFVIGHVGRFTAQKNHVFLIDVFNQILKKNSSSLLLLIGQGDLEQEIQEKIHNLHIEKNVLFLGARNDVEDFYQAMDILLFPSLYEGLPITLLEAQTSGLTCIISDTITKEVDITKLIHRESLKSSPQEWAETVVSNIVSSKTRHSRTNKMADAGYDIKTTAKRIVEMYEDLCHLEL